MVAELQWKLASKVIFLTGQTFSSDDPELWDFTLDGIEMLEDPVRESSGMPRPATPSEHTMVTRSKTPQRATTLRPSFRSHDNQGQGGPTNYRHNNSAAQNTAIGTGKANLYKG